MSSTSSSRQRKLTALGAEASTPAAPATTCVSATHEILFETDSVKRCDTCRTEIVEDDGVHVSGRGLLVFARGDEVRYEEPHLCDECAAAVGITQHRIWDLEDDEEG
jgi:hypothetical protein